MKQILIVCVYLLLIPATLTLCQKENSPHDSEETRIVQVLPVAALRAKPSIHSRLIAKLPFGTMVAIISSDGRAENLLGYKGNWIKVKHKELTGWIFSSLLSHLPNPTPYKLYHGQLIPNHWRRISKSKGSTGKRLIVIPDRCESLEHFIFSNLIPSSSLSYITPNSRYWSRSRNFSTNARFSLTLGMESLTEEVVVTGVSISEAIRIAQACNSQFEKKHIKIKSNNSVSLCLQEEDGYSELKIKLRTDGKTYIEMGDYAHSTCISSK